MKLTINSVTPFARVANLRCELLVFMYSSLYFVLNLPQRMHVMQLFVLFQLNRQKMHGTVFNKFDKYYVHIVSSWCTASEISRKKIFQTCQEILQKFCIRSLYSQNYKSENIFIAKVSIFIQDLASCSGCKVTKKKVF